MTKKTLYMETTEIAASRTASEIVAELVKAGAIQINTEYANGEITGLRWIMRIGGNDALFAIPARVAPVEKILLRRRSGHVDNAAKSKIAEQARRVAWRQLLRWTQAQLAMVECGMTEAAEVFFPYLQTPAGVSLFDTFKDQGMKMLPPGETRNQ